MVATWVVDAVRAPRWLVGVDLVEVAEVGASLRRFGDRYLHRVFTEHEIASCAGPDGVLAPSLAARFAAKEAVIKVLRPAGHGIDLRSIEVCRAGDGSCSIRLSGGARRLARRGRIRGLGVSLAHDGPMAVAVVVGTRGLRLRPPGRSDPCHAERL